MNKIVEWYHNNYNEITWFLIGFLVMAGFNELSRHDYTSAIVSFGLAGLNYFLAKR
jgi:hypothetical protein